MDKGNSFSNGPGAGNSAGNSAYHGADVPVIHGEFCPCAWCLQGVR